MSRIPPPSLRCFNFSRPPGSLWHRTAVHKRLLCPERDNIHCVCHIFPHTYATGVCSSYQRTQRTLPRFYPTFEFPADYNSGWWCTKIFSQLVGWQIWSKTYRSRRCSGHQAEQLPQDLVYFLFNKEVLTHAWLLVNPCVVERAARRLWIRGGLIWRHQLQKSVENLQKLRQCPDCFFPVEIFQ